MLSKLILLLSFTFSVLEIICAENNNSLDYSFDRNHNYSTYYNFANATCDLTENLCDSSCCEDKDCDEWQRKSFQCSDTKPTCDEISSHLDCNCNNDPDRPEWFPLLCSIHVNPIYLGMFYSQPRKFESLSALNKVISKKNHLFKYKKESTKIHSPADSVSYYKYNSPLKIYYPSQDFSKFPSISSLPVKVSVGDSTNACTQGFARFKVNELTSCVLKITEDLCQNSHTLGISPYLVQDGSTSPNEGIPFILKSLDFLEGISTKIVIKCASLSHQVSKFGKKIFSIFDKANTQPCNENPDLTKTIWTENICQNVLIDVRHEFLVNFSDIIDHRVQYTIANISLFDPISINRNKTLTTAATYVKQVFNVTFVDVVHGVSEKRNFSDDAFFNRGYHMNEILNFGYRRVENASVSWERGSLSVFQNGKTCEHLTPVTFGYNFFSFCRLGKKFTSCGELRNYTEMTFDALLDGDSIAPYSLFRPPYEGPVTFLRNYRNNSDVGKESNSTVCHVPLSQDVIIQYTSTPVVNGRPVHRIIGMRADRKFQNGTIPQISGRFLVSRILFFDVTSFNRKRRTRFWEKMYSPEKSENSWLRMFEAFDGDAGPEVTFWLIMLTLGGSAVLIFTKLDVTYVEGGINELQ